MAEYNNIGILDVNDIKGIFTEKTADMLKTEPYCLSLVNDINIYDGEMTVIRELTPMQRAENIPEDAPLKLGNRKPITYQTRRASFYLGDTITHEQQMNKIVRFLKVFWFMHNGPAEMACTHDKSLFSAIKDVVFLKSHTVSQEPWNDDAGAKYMNYGINPDTVRKAKDILCAENRWRSDIVDNFYLLINDAAYEAFKKSGRLKYSNTGKPGSYVDMSEAENFLGCKIVKFPDNYWEEAGFFGEEDEIGKAGKVLLDYGFLAPRGLFKFLGDNNGVASLGGNINMKIRPSLNSEYTTILLADMMTGVTIAGPQKLIKVKFRCL